jgi:hypothetical protein
MDELIDVGHQTGEALSPVMSRLPGNKNTWSRLEAWEVLFFQPGKNP